MPAESHLTPWLEGTSQLCVSRFNIAGLRYWKRSWVLVAVRRYNYLSFTRNTLCFSYRYAIPELIYLTSL
jgi:hypothetical protein